MTPHNPKQKFLISPEDIFGLKPLNLALPAASLQKQEEGRLQRGWGRAKLIL